MSVSCLALCCEHLLMELLHFEFGTLCTISIVWQIWCSISARPFWILKEWMTIVVIFVIHFLMQWQNIFCRSNVICKFCDSSLIFLKWSTRVTKHHWRICSFIFKLFKIVTLGCVSSTTTIFWPSIIIFWLKLVHKFGSLRYHRLTKQTRVYSFILVRYDFFSISSAREGSRSSRGYISIVCDKDQFGRVRNRLWWYIIRLSTCIWLRSLRWNSIVNTAELDSFIQLTLLSVCMKLAGDHLGPSSKCNVWFSWLWSHSSCNRLWENTSKCPLLLRYYFVSSFLLYRNSLMLPSSIAV